MRQGIVLFAFLVTAATTALAQQQYVSDDLVITLRTGPSTQNAIVRNLSAGQVVTVLERLPGGEYARVRTADGTEGFALTQYLQDSPTAELRLQTTARELADAREQLETLQTRVEELTAGLSAANSELGTLRTTEAGLSNELADIRQASASVIEVREQNESLRRRVTELDAQLDVVTIENNELRSRNNQNWFVIGAAVLFGGIVIGLVAPSLRPKKRSSW